MTKKPTKATEAEAATADQEQALDETAQTSKSTADPAPDMEALPEIDAGDGIEAEEVEPEEPQDAPTEPAQEPAIDPVPAAPETAPAVDPEDPTEATGQQLGTLAQMITDMLVWQRPLLVTRLVLDHGMDIDRSIAGVRVTLAGIEAESPIIGPGGEHQALDNWGNAARRRILELEAAG